MTSARSRAFYRKVHPDLVRALLEGQRIRVHAVRLCLVRDQTEGPGFSIDRPRIDGMPKLWHRTTRKLCRILQKETEKVTDNTQSALSVVAHLMPDDTPVPLIVVESWLSMGDGGGACWEVSTGLDPAVFLFPDLFEVADRVRKKTLQEVIKI